VGDRVKLESISAALLAPDGSTDTQSLQGMVVVTAATVTKEPACTEPAVGDPDPCGAGFACLAGACLTLPQDLSSVTGQGEFADYEHEWVTAELELTGPGTTTDGFVTFPARTTNAAKLPVQLKAPADVAQQAQLGEGLTLVASVPLWKQDGHVQFAAWRREDLVVPPAFVHLSPSEGAINVEAAASPATVETNFEFPSGLDPATLSSTEVTCSDPANEDTVLLSADGFNSCVPVAVSSPAARTLSLQPATALSPGKRYQVRLPASLTGGLPVTSRLGFVTVPASTCTDRRLVISQVFPSGGLVTGFDNDFVEIHNRSSLAWDLGASALVLAVADKDGTAWTAVDVSGYASSFNLTTLPAGGYLRVELPDNGILVPAGGLVALVLAANAPTDGACPAAPPLDRVGYGTAPLCSEGRPAPAPAPGLSLLRQLDGCVDHGSNDSDFAHAAPLERSFGSPAVTCYCGGGGATDVTAAGVADTMDSCIASVSDGSAQFSSITLTSPYRAYLQLDVRESGATEAAGQNPDIRVEFGLVPVSGGTVPPLHRWTFMPRSYFVPIMETGINDFYEVCDPAIPGQCTPGLATPAAGTWKFVARVTSAVGPPKWTFCDADGSGSDPGAGAFDLSNAGTLTVTAPGVP